MAEITAAQARSIGVAVLESRGVSRLDATIQADHLVEGDLRGHASHGIQRLPVITRRLDAGLTKATAIPEVVAHTDSIFTVNGRRALGPVAATAALEHAFLVAASQGVAVAGIRDCGHLGMLAPYVEAAARRRFIGLAMSVSEALVHPTGGHRAMLGTNPFAIGVPLEGKPFIFDMATSAISMGEVLHKKATGQQLSPGVAIGADGEPTTDPEAALAGALSPFGGYKGFGLGLAIELIIPLITGSAIGTEVAGTLDAEHACNKGDLFILIAPGRFGPGREGFVRDYLQEVAEEIAPRGVTTPGERSLKLRRERLADGFEVPDSLWNNEIPALLGEGAS